MAMTIRVRALGDEEAAELARMARSRTLGAGLVRRAQIVQHAAEGLSAPGIAAKLGLCGGAAWCGASGGGCGAALLFCLMRLSGRGGAGRGENLRSGPPPIYSAAERSA